MRRESVIDVRHSAKEDIQRVLLDDHERVLGWVGGEHNYGFLWDSHPLSSGGPPGCGRMLVRDVVREVAPRGGLTLQEIGRAHV